MVAEGVCGQRDNRRLRHGSGQGTDNPGRLQPIHIGHHDIHQHQVVGYGLHRLDGFFATGHRIDPMADQLQPRDRHQPIGRVVLGQQNPQPACRRYCGLRRWGGRRCFGHVVDIQHDVEAHRGTMAFLTDDVDCAAHLRHQTAANRQAQAGTAKATRDRGVGLEKLSEQVGLRGLGDANAGVRDPELQPRLAFTPVAQRGLYGDAAGVGEFQSVAHQVQQNLPQPTWVPQHTLRHVRAVVDDQRQMLFRGLDRHKVNDAGNHLFDIEGNVLEVQPSGFKLGKIKNFIDDALQILGGVPQYFGEPQLAGIELAIQQ